MDTTTQKQIAPLMAALRKGDTSVISRIVEIFNSRPMRRADDIRVQGWACVMAD